MAITWEEYLAETTGGSNTTANNIMRLVQKEFDDKMYISVKFNK